MTRERAGVSRWSDSQPVVVLVHGAFHGAWCWEPLLGDLALRGVAATAVELPYTSYEDDVAAVRRAVGEASGPVVLVGHSLVGGLVCSAAAATFFSDVAPDVAGPAVSRLRPVSASSMTGVPPGEPWRTKPASYLFCTRDRALPLEAQRAFAGCLAGTTHGLDTSHSPFLTRPAEVAEIVAGWVQASRS
ncbi:alpha/beta fold hydrolase [Amycolatopsis alkalitolerans]|uniref:Alpha/beta hydrolase n=1 Tax=Amycolatopsis alkalitolerans TaxID=2547244 RepID=A0A5C4LS47_9PSEU|nr:alpha/beta hydrolase family protein [Amycolatopsis alkalitolerans]TNC20604.1 alpha/beta hydrolase [Amycolatopsis alkalitolerans]